MTKQGVVVRERECLIANPSILKNLFAHKQSYLLVRRGHLDCKVYQVRMNFSTNNLSVTYTMSWRKACEIALALVKIY